MTKKSTAKKKTTTKRTAKKKAVVQEVPKVELQRAATVEFNIDNPEQAAEICAHLKQLETTIGWIYLKRFLLDSMKVIERQIITKKCVHTGEKLDEGEVDQLRMSYLAYEELAEKPHILIQNLSQGNKPTSPRYDPFARDLSETGVEYAGVLDDDGYDD